MLVSTSYISLPIILHGLIQYKAFLTRFSGSLRSQIMPYFVCLLVANLLQAAGTFMNVRWVMDREVVAGHYCSFQGGLKNGGNVGMALWWVVVLLLNTRDGFSDIPWHRSFILSLHIFSVLFLRLKPSSAGRYIVVIVGWAAIATVVAVGPLAIQTKSRGSYFGPSGFWSVHRFQMDCFPLICYAGAG